VIAMSEANSGRPTLSIVIPTLNEEHSLANTLDALAQLTGDVEVIVADGGSADSTRDIARAHGARVVTGDRGRGMQMHNGARVAHGEVLLFLHADTIILSDAAARIREALAKDESILGGNFAVEFDGKSRSARFLTWLYPKLGKLGLCYGDSAIFVRRSVYQDIGGFKSYPIFEDLDLVRRLRKRGRMAHLPFTVLTSSRRFEDGSFPLTFARWFILQGLYWLGISPWRLHRLYAPVRRVE
jgi:rSAM/selenodomain-associated transferase 2